MLSERPPIATGVNEGDAGATLTFDATGGGKLASQILSCMDAAANRNAKQYSRYGSTAFKQVYL